MEVRSAVRDDAASIAAINVSSWRAAYNGHVDRRWLDELDVGVRETEWRAYLEAPGPEDRVLLVVEEEVVLGYTRTAPARDADLDPDETAEICGFYVDPDAWGRGAGRRLMSAVLADLAGRGFAAIVLWVVATNDRARRFYEQAGFVPEGRSDKPFFGAPQVRYRADLSPRPK